MKIECSTSHHERLLIKNVFPLNNQRFRHIYVTMGLPGVGKSSFCEQLSHSFVQGECRMIKRDQKRMDILWDIRKEEPEKQEEMMKNIDDLTTNAVLDEFELAYDNPAYTGFIIDGCHTRADATLYLLSNIRRIVKDDPSLITVCVVGSPYSGSYYELTDQSEGDYSGFERDGTHRTIPRCIFEKKKRELIRFLTDEENFETMSFLIDSYMIIPSFDGRFIEVEPR